MLYRRITIPLPFRNDLELKRHEWPKQRGDNRVLFRRRQRRKTASQNPSPEVVKADSSLEQAQDQESHQDVSLNSETSKERVWLELARLEQEVAELAQVVATKHEKAAELWKTVADEEVKLQVHELSTSAWSLERNVLRLVEIALKQAKGELQNA